MTESREQFERRLESLTDQAVVDTLQGKDGTTVFDVAHLCTRRGYAAALRDVSIVFVERPMTFGVDAYCDAKAIKVIDDFAASLGIDMEDK